MNKRSQARFKNICNKTSCENCQDMFYSHSRHRWCYCEKYNLPLISPEKHRINGKTYRVLTNMLSNNMKHIKNQTDDYSIYVDGVTTTMKSAFA